MNSSLGTVIDFIFSDRNTDSEVTIMCNGIRIKIAISAGNLERSPTIKNKYLHFLQVAEDYELDGLTVDDFYDWILEGCATDFLRLPQPAYPTTPTLEDYIHSDTFLYTLHATEDDKFALLRTTNVLDEELPFGAQVRDELSYSWPTFDPSQVQICADSLEQALSQTPRKVFTCGGCSYFFKPYRSCDSALATHELAKYAEIRQAGLDGLRISRLFGLVRDNEGTIFGLLLSYIESKSVTLGCAIRLETSASLRQQWADQVTNTVARLHRAGIIWGDVKPDNVLIDAQNNAWVIDFGGGYTQGWVERDVAGTLQGDQQGLSRIVQWIYA